MSKPVFAALLAALALLSPNVNGTADNEFERVPRAGYTDMIRSAWAAYSAKQYDLAFTDFRRLSCAGDKMSQATLGRMYLLGQGIAEDDLQAYLWLKLSTESDIPPIYTALVKKIEDGFNPEQRRFTAGRADALRSLYGLTATNMSCRKASTTSFASNVQDSLECWPMRERSQFLLRRCVDASN